jgi:glycosyltransferase involved in cell wall biosynthesis
VGPTSVGVVIRTLNESELIGTCLDTLREQRGDFELDFVVVDSGSTDSTVEIARSRDARIVDVPPGEFDYSKALNVGIEQVRGDLILNLSAHAIPVDDQWLERMVEPFQNPKVAGVSSRQVPWPDAPWQEVHRLERQFPSNGWVTDGSEQNIVFSNAASLIRRGVWSDHPFTLPAAEDLDWAHRVVAAGWSVVYEARAAVYHSHYEDARARAARLIDLNRVPARRRTRRRTLREAAGILFRDGKKILGLDEPLRRKARYLAELVKMVCYYVLDFSRSGTTAERRRAADTSSSSKPRARRPV